MMLDEKYTERQIRSSKVDFIPTQGAGFQKQFQIYYLHAAVFPLFHNFLFGPRYTTDTNLAGVTS